jgi:hypothetical protein
MTMTAQVEVGSGGVEALARRHHVPDVRQALQPRLGALGRHVLCKALAQRVLA